MVPTDTCYNLFLIKDTIVSNVGYPVPLSVVWLFNYVLDRLPLFITRPFFCFLLLFFVTSWFPCQCFFFCKVFSWLIPYFFDSRLSQTSFRKVIFKVFHISGILSFPRLTTRRQDASYTPVVSIRVSVLSIKFSLFWNKIKNCCVCCSYVVPKPLTHSYYCLINNIWYIKTKL